MSRRAWLVLPDQLSIRVFVDTGIVDGLRERLEGALAASVSFVGRSRSDRARKD